MDIRIRANRLSHRWQQPSISLQETKSSSEIKNIVTTDDELYKALSTTDTKISPSAKEVLRYRESLWVPYFRE